MTTQSTNPKTFLSQPEAARVVDAIKAAEKGTTGEIRVRIARKCGRPPLEAAQITFHALRMDQTAQRNGVLLYLSLVDREFAVFGDEGIDRHIGCDGWNAIRDRLADRFKKDQFADGLAEAITDIGKTLAKHFPGKAGDRNELSDDLSLGR
ncbi:MAG TPA: TPM domain-containing protein [Candidatus Eisenbacteria bacterium]